MLPLLRMCLVFVLLVGACNGAPPAAKAPKKVDSGAKTPPEATNGISGLRGKQFVVVAAESKVVAKVYSGSSRPFDVTFTGLAGTFVGDVQDLQADDIRVEVTANAASIDTGIPTRDGHAKDNYMLVGKYPSLSFKLSKVTALTKQEQGFSFTANGMLTVMEQPIPTEVSGTVAGEDGKMIVEAKFMLKPSATPIKAGDLFDKDEIPVSVRLVLAAK